MAESHHNSSCGSCRRYISEVAGGGLFFHTLIYFPFLHTGNSWFFTESNQAYICRPNWLSISWERVQLNIGVKISLNRTPIHKWTLLLFFHNEIVVFSTMVTQFIILAWVVIFQSSEWQIDFSTYHLNCSFLSKFIWPNI